METFIEKFSSNYRLSPADAQDFVAQMEEVRFGKYETIVTIGSRNSDFYLLKQGIWRGYYLRKEDDLTIWFASEGESAFSVWGYMDNSPSKICIEAMSDSIAYRISRSDLERLFASSTALANMGRRLMEQQLLSIENWLLSNGSPRAKERYLALVRETPELLQHVPLKYIASYLWITPQSLSRIRASFKE